MIHFKNCNCRRKGRRDFIQGDNCLLCTLDQHEKEIRILKDIMVKKLEEMNNRIHAMEDKKEE